MVHHPRVARLRRQIHLLRLGSPIVITDRLISEVGKSRMLIIVIIVHVLLPSDTLFLWSYT